MTRNASASITSAGLRSMTRASGSAANSMMPTVMTTAATMIGTSSVMPTAVRIESTEKTMSIAMIWAMAAPKAICIKNVASPDFSVLVLLFAVFGKLEWFLWIAAIGSMVFAAVMLWIVRPSGLFLRSVR